MVHGNNGLGLWGEMSSKNAQQMPQKGELILDQIDSSKVNRVQI